jgi:hypothetical protein
LRGPFRFWGPFGLHWAPFRSLWEAGPFGPFGSQEPGLRPEKKKEPEKKKRRKKKKRKKEKRKKKKRKK